MNLKRRLDRYESTVSYFAAAGLEYEGIINFESFRAAIKDLSKRNPILRCTIEHEGDSKWLVDSTESKVRFAVKTDIELTKEGISKEAYRQTSEANEQHSLINITILPSINYGHILVTFSHSVFDGGSFFSFLSELWSTYIGIVDGSNLPRVSRGRLPSSPYELLRERNLEHLIYNSKEKSRPASIASDPTDAKHDVEFQSWKIALTQNETAKLEKVCKSNSLSVTNIICGTVLSSQYKFSREGKPGKMRFYSLINLRNRVSPPVNAAESTNFVAWHVAEFLISSGLNTIEIAHEFKKQLDYSLMTLSGLSVINQRFLPSKFETNIEDNLAGATISSAGSMSKSMKLEHSSASIANIYWATHQTSEPIIRTQMSKEAIQLLPKAPHYVVLTTNGKLEITSHAWCCDSLDKNIFDQRTFKDLRSSLLSEISSTLSSASSRT